jgi:hypothetical protein
MDFLTIPCPKRCFFSVSLSALFLLQSHSLYCNHFDVCTCHWYGQHSQTLVSAFDNIRCAHVINNDHCLHYVLDQRWVCWDLSLHQSEHCQPFSKILQCSDYFPLTAIDFYEPNRGKIRLIIANKVLRFLMHSLKIWAIVLIASPQNPIDI